jgi:ribosomal protein S24E
LDFKVKQDTYNPILKRKEVSLEVDHDGQGTPSRIDLRKAVASKYNTKQENVFVVDMETKTGTQSAVCAVEVYDDAKVAQQTVPKYIQVRNLPPDERKKVREQEAKKEEAKPKPEKPKAQAQKPAEGKEQKPAEEAKEAKEPKEAKPKSEAKPPAEAPKKGKEVEAK